MEEIPQEEKPDGRFPDRHAAAGLLAERAYNPSEYSQENGCAITFI